MQQPVYAANVSYCGRRLHLVAPAPSPDPCIDCITFLLVAIIATRPSSLLSLFHRLVVTFFFFSFFFFSPFPSPALPESGSAPDFTIAHCPALHNCLPSRALLLLHEPRLIHQGTKNPVHCSRQTSNSHVWPCLSWSRPVNAIGPSAPCVLYRVPKDAGDHPEESGHQEERYGELIGTHYCSFGANDTLPHCDMVFQPEQCDHELSSVLNTLRSQLSSTYGCHAKLCCVRLCCSIWEQPNHGGLVLVFADF